MRGWRVLARREERWGWKSGRNSGVVLGKDMVCFGLFKDPPGYCMRRDHGDKGRTNWRLVLSASSHTLGVEEGWTE
jgi:hypothetical protein